MGNNTTTSIRFILLLLMEKQAQSEVHRSQNPFLLSFLKMATPVRIFSSPRSSSFTTVLFLKRKPNKLSHNTSHIHFVHIYYYVINTDKCECVFLVDPVIFFYVAKYILHIILLYYILFRHKVHVMLDQCINVFN